MSLNLCQSQPLSQPQPLSQQQPHQRKIFETPYVEQPVQYQ